MFARARACERRESDDGRVDAAFGRGGADVDDDVDVATFYDAAPRGPSLVRRLLERVRRACPAAALSTGADTPLERLADKVLSRLPKATVPLARTSELRSREPLRLLLARHRPGLPLVRLVPGNPL